METQAAILREEPRSLSDLALPEALERVLLRCVEKRPDSFHSGPRPRARARVDRRGAARCRCRRPARRSRSRAPPGLRAFTEELRDRFFGREAEVAGLWEKLQRRKLLSLIGPSGVGEASFVRAGLVRPVLPAGGV